jgi:hypothetical protein
MDTTSNLKTNSKTNSFPVIVTYDFKTKKFVDLTITEINNNIIDPIIHKPQEDQYELLTCLSSFETNFASMVSKHNKGVNTEFDELLHRLEK